MRKPSYKVYDPIKFHMIFSFFMVDSRDTVVFNFTLYWIFDTIWVQSVESFYLITNLQHGYLDHLAHLDLVVLVVSNKGLHR